MIRATALLFDCVALVVLSFVPLAGPLGLADVEVTPAALTGWFFMAAPLAISVVAIVVDITRAKRFAGPWLAQLSLVTCTCALAISLLMMIGSQAPAVGDPASMRGFAMVASAVFAINLLALWRACDFGSDRLPSR